MSLHDNTAMRYQPQYMTNQDGNGMPPGSQVVSSMLMPKIETGSSQANVATVASAVPDQRFQLPQPHMQYTTMPPQTQAQPPYPPLGASQGVLYSHNMIPPLVMPEQQQMGQEQMEHISPSGQLIGRTGKPLTNTKRAAQNRNAQRAFRQRKERYIKDLERKSEEYDAMRERLELVQRENSRIREHCATLQRALTDRGVKLEGPLAGPELHSHLGDKLMFKDSESA